MTRCITQLTSDRRRRKIWYALCPTEIAIAAGNKLRARPVPPSIDRYRNLLTKRAEFPSSVRHLCLVYTAAIGHQQGFHV